MESLLYHTVAMYLVLNISCM